MKFLYKIHSGYDGFTPSSIPERMNSKRVLLLSWTRYLESVEPNDEVWIYFCGPHKFETGVYVRGRVQSVRTQKSEVLLRVVKYATEHPITDPRTSKVIATSVSARGRQVFLFPEQWKKAPTCIDESDKSCEERMCSSCPSWRKLALIKRNALGWPARLCTDGCHRFVPAYWVIPRRCGIHRLSEAVHRTSALFMRFKIGAASLAAPLALGIHARLRGIRQTEFDCIVPIPLSPDKERKGEINRTRLLARELGKLTGIPVRSMLKLRRPISKRKLRNKQGFSAAEFEAAYAKALVADPVFTRYSRILLIDDVCTEGSTLSIAIGAILAKSPECVIVAATAGQMVVKAAVKKVRLLR